MNEKLTTEKLTVEEKLLLLLLLLLRSITIITLSILKSQPLWALSFLKILLSFSIFHVKFIPLSCNHDFLKQNQIRRFLQVSISLSSRVSMFFPLPNSCISRFLDQLCSIYQCQCSELYVCVRIFSCNAGASVNLITIFFLPIASDNNYRLCYLNSRSYI